jgi:A/G-specific adenine glycosylase
MLHRTNARQVVPSYLEFEKKYPTLRVLSKAPDREIYEFFSRLGLDWRARNVVHLIHDLNHRFKGVIPRTVSDLKLLPGVGEYIAKAVACYAFGDAVAPIDTNVVRVTSRLFGLPYSPDSGRRRKDVRLVADTLVSSGHPKELNLALLDFAAIVCRPKPKCNLCPLRTQCNFYFTGTQMLS